MFLSQNHISNPLFPVLVLLPATYGVVQTNRPLLSPLQNPQSPPWTTANEDERCSLPIDARDQYPSSPSITSGQQKTCTKLHMMILMYIWVLFLYGNHSLSLYLLRPDGILFILQAPGLPDMI